MSQKSKRRRAVYVVTSSNCPGYVLGVHGGRASAESHHGSVVTDRERWYRQEWDRRDQDTGYTREHDPLLTIGETRLVWASVGTVRGYGQPEAVTVRTLRVWLS